MLSRRTTTIRGKQVGQKISKIKPSRARKIIRRFHLLINKRRIICRKLGLAIADNNEDACTAKVLEHIATSSSKAAYESGWHESHPSSKFEAEMLGVQDIDDKPTLIKILGYIMCEIHEHGGLENYQTASTIGQHSDRGGDSSKMLIKWLKECQIAPSTFRALEIGSLSSRNYISTSGLFDTVVRIDLNSNDPANIERQDFMERPLPKDDAQRFDVISCSLVLNFVPSPRERGAMLSRLQSFLRQDVQTTYIFIVLPLPCIVHSRYMSEALFCDIMLSLGYARKRFYEAKKIAYFLFERENETSNASLMSNKTAQKPSKFSKKVLINDKPGLNNFSIIL